MNTITQKATVTQVPFGGIEIEGLLLENGEFAIAFSQLQILDLIPPNRSQKQLESLLGICFQSHQKAKTSLHPKAVNIINLDELKNVILASANKGNLQAQNLRDSLVGLSLTQLFSDAFNIKFDKEDRQEWLKSRIQGKVVRRTLTDAVKDWLDRNEASENTRKFIYSNVSDCLNKALFGKTSKQLKDERGCDTNELLRDSHSDKDLQRIEHHETFTMKLVDKLDKNPLEAMKEAIDFYK
jgi:hypothetical protein